MPDRSKRWQVGLRTLFLLMAAIAVWMTVIINRRQNTYLEARIRAMRPLAHELLVDDASKIAVVRMDELWMDDNRWDLHLPPGSYRLCLATRKVDDKGLPDAVKTVPIPSGRHRLALEQRQDGDLWHIRVLLDGAELLAVEETKDWASSSSTGGGDYSLSQQLPPDRPAVLFRRRYMQTDAQGRSQTPTVPSEGLILWIEPAAGSKPSS
jgi:hypothetical protein